MSTVQVACPLCATPASLDNQSAGALVRCRTCGKSFVGPRELAVIGRPHNLSVFPLTGLLLLHYATVGMFSIVYVNLMHDRLPRVRRTDPSGLVAVGLSFVPGVNLLWSFFTLRRLCVRINEQRRLRGLAETAPQTMAIMVATLLLCGFLATILPITGWVLLGATNAILIPVFLAVLQASVNELVSHPGPPVREAAQQNHADKPSERSASHRDRDLRSSRERGPLQGAGADRSDGL